MLSLAVAACGPRFPVGQPQVIITEAPRSGQQGQGGQATIGTQPSSPGLAPGPAVQLPRDINARRNAVVRGGVIKVGGLFPLTGGLSALGKPAYQSAQAYFNYLNDRGGVRGKRIQFVVCDDRAEDTRSTTCARKLVEQDGVFIMGPSFTPFSLTVIGRLESDGVPWVGYDGINVEGFDASNVVTVGAPIETMGHALLPYWYDKIERETGSPPRKIGAVVLAAAPAETYVREAERVICPKLGCEIVEKRSVTYTTTDYATICRAMQSKRVDAVWIVTDPASAVKLLVGCRDLAGGYKPPKGFLGQHGIYLDLTLDQVGRFADGIYANSAVVPDTVASPPTDEMKRIVRTYYPDASFGYFAELGFASARLVADVIDGILAGGAELNRGAVLSRAAAMTSYDCHGLCRGVNLRPPASRTGGNHNVWIVRADFSSGAGRWVMDAGPIDAFNARTWPCRGRPRPC